MTNYDVFNGDADGICALLQLRLADPRDATLVTGVKRDIDLLKQVEAKKGDRITVLDISMDKNHSALVSVLDNGAEVTYFDHHFAGDIPQHDQLTANIDTAAEICTGLLVNQHLNGKHLPWAVTAAFGDNLFAAAKQAAAPLNLSDAQLAQLEELGTLLNYNGYGATVDDLFFAPDDLFKKLLPYSDPFEFMKSDTTFATLKAGYESDMAKAKAVEPNLATNDCAVFAFPQESWSRRVGGVYGNELARDYPDRAHALLSAISADTYQVSVRAPLNRREGADELCRQFESGGGRKAAAGINNLPESETARFTELFQQQFATGA